MSLAVEGILQGWRREGSPRGGLDLRSDNHAVYSELEKRLGQYPGVLKDSREVLRAQGRPEQQPWLVGVPLLVRLVHTLDMERSDVARGFSVKLGQMFHVEVREEGLTELAVIEERLKGVTRRMPIELLVKMDHNLMQVLEKWKGSGGVTPIVNLETAMHWVVHGEAPPQGPRYDRLDVMLGVGRGTGRGKR